MRFIEDLYTYDIKDKKINKLLRKISHQKRVNKLYVVIFPLFGDGILEVYNYNQLLQPYYKKRTDDIEIVGISRGRAGADMIILGIIQDMCDKNCTDFSNIRGFVE